MSPLVLVHAVVVLLIAHALRGDLSRRDLRLPFPVAREAMTSTLEDCQWS